MIMTNSIPPKNGKTWIWTAIGTVIAASIIAVVTTLIVHTSSLAAQEVENVNMKACIEDIKTSQREMKVDQKTISNDLGQLRAKIGIVDERTQIILREIRNKH